MRSRIPRGLDRLVLAVIFWAGAMSAAPAYAHHEALFGPQSSAALSPTLFLSAQIFDTQRGKGDEKTHSTTTVFSGGVKPSRMPVSLSFVVPFSVETEVGGATRRGVEDSLFSAKYQRDTNRLSEALHLEQSFFMAVGGLELPTGNLDHPFGHGRPGTIAAVLMSLEKRPLALIAYAYAHRAGEYEGNRASGNVFAGGGVAFTPIDDEEHGKLFSLQWALRTKGPHESTRQVFPSRSVAAAVPFSIRR